MFIFMIYSPLLLFVGLVSAHYELFIGTILDIGYFQDQTPDSIQLATCKGKLSSLHPILNICHCVKVSRMTVGTHVGGCRPVVVSFKNFAEVRIKTLCFCKVL